MRTRSKASSETFDRASEAAKRKRKDDDPGVGYAERRSKRCKTQFYAEVASASPSTASRAKSPLKRKGHNSTSSTSNNGHDGAFTMTLEKSMGAIRKRGAADKSSTGEKSCASFRKSVTKKQGTKTSEHAHSLDDHHGRGNENSTEGGTIEQCSSSLLLNTGVKHCSTDNITPTQGGPMDQRSSAFARNVCTSGAHTCHGQNELQISDSPLSPQEVACTHKDGHHNVADAIVKGKTGSCHMRRGASAGGCPTTSSKRRLEEQPLSCPHSGKSKGCQGYIKRSRNRRKKRIGTILTEVSQVANSQKRLNAAKSRWKNLAQNILRTKISPEKLASTSENMTRSIANSQHKKILSPPKNRTKRSNASTVDQRPLAGKMQQKIRKQQPSLLRRMKTWLAEAKFSQGPKEKNSNDGREEFLMTEDERCAFAQTMVKGCQKNPNMRTIFLEAVRMLTSSGLMEAAASNLLLQGPCEEAQIVMNAWEEFREQNTISKTLPMNLLNAVNQLHEKRGDLLAKLSTPNIAGICTLSQIDEKTWKFQLPGFPPEDSLLPRNVGQDTTV